MSLRPVTIEDGRVVTHGAPDVPPHVTAVMGRLRRWSNRLRGRYGVPIYLCGSALRPDNPDPRDWDIRIMLPDDRFALAFGPVDEWRDEGCTGQWTRTRFRWSDQCVKDTQDFANWCHLNGDVQLYPESHAATMYANQPRLRLDTFPDPAEPDILGRLATAETALADRDRHFAWDERLRMEREIGDLVTERDRLRGYVRLYGRELAASRQALATAYPALRRITLGQYDRVTEEQVRDLLDWCDRQGIAAPSTGTTPP